MVGIKIKDIDKDLLMMFALSYEYSMSFTNVLKLFKISKQYFWTFMEICSPMLKMGVRKASMLRKSVNKILPYLTGEGEKLTLTVKEDCMLDLFRWFIEESFTDGEGCLTIEQLEAIPFAKGYTEKFCGDLDMNQISNLTIKDMLRRISDGQDELEQREKECCGQGV